MQEQAVEIEAHISRSLTDPLTGLPNRREFNERLEERMGAWNRRREVFSLLLLDVDHFKKLNDQHGHLAGDQVLAAIGGALRGRDSSRGCDRPVRRRGIRDPVAEHVAGAGGARRPESARGGGSDGREPQSAARSR